MNLQQDEFLKHALLNEQNLKIAILAGIAFGDLRRMLIESFAKKLKTTLGESGWDEIDVEKLKSQHWARFRKTSWGKKVDVCFGASNNFSRHYLGVIAEKDKFDDEFRASLSRQITNNLGKGECNNFTPWQQQIFSEYANLNTLDGLFNISDYHSDGTVNDLVTRINEIGSYIEEVLAEIN